MTAVTLAIPVVAPLRLQYIVSCKVKVNEGKICLDSFLKDFATKVVFICSTDFQIQSTEMFTAFNIDFVFTVKKLVCILCAKFKLGESVDHFT